MLTSWPCQDLDNAQELMEVLPQVGRRYLEGDQERMQLDHVNEVEVPHPLQTQPPRIALGCSGLPKLVSNDSFLTRDDSMPGRVLHLPPRLQPVKASHTSQ